MGLLLQSCLHAIKGFGLHIPVKAAPAMSPSPIVRHLLPSLTSQYSTEKQTADAKSVTQEDDWTEVVHQETGQIYYWNQRTGETTALGEPKPGSDGQRSRQQQQSNPDEGFRRPIVEPPLKDNTVTYAIYGAVIGVFSGWAAQFV